MKLNSETRILIVEDDRNTLSGLIEIMEMEGYDVIGVDHPRVGLAKHAICKFDVLLTDLRLPEMDGFQLHREAVRVSPKLTTIIMTAFISNVDIAQARKNGIFEVISKPIDLDNLFQTIQIALSEPAIQQTRLNLQHSIYA